ncbi:DNA polymerase family protein (macronuclear) [Tetrahymena thermophila SB210]|uniref:DNA polymerase n=1 Tax=Tetrahymena thermophila (strain SB210) TaxID=312017 RepID=Q233J3_TETTS|nr:DNA polymerase family protein [Tetrahymena thermophila SB210]EAR91587.2 DNA polymerase family protein [Tetrahymena thermophila SB210]|eukprot:XP_001011832.2 DNA polymerase family protein [Tetrahymena thermophila SB210]
MNQKQDFVQQQIQEKDKQMNALDKFENTQIQQQPDQISLFLFSHEQIALNLPGHPASNYSIMDIINFQTDFSFYEKIFDRKNRKILQAPVARMYGNDKQGNSVCLHIHGYFPYFYLKVNQISHLIQNDKTFLDKFIDLIEECYYTLYSVSEKQKKFLMSTTPIILNYEIIYKKDIYGYHSTEEPFLKIYFYNPKMIKKLVGILESGVVMNIEFVIYEGHLTHFLKLYSDLDIKGLREIKLLKYSLRKNENQALQQLTKEREICKYYLNSKNKFNSMTKVSTCDVEIDVYYKNILNYIFLQEEKSEENFIEMCSDLELAKNCKQRTRECSVQINKSLEMFWKEEKQMQEDLFGIKSMKATQTIDYTDNIESLFMNEDDEKEFNLSRFQFNGFSGQSTFLQEQKQKKLQEKQELLKKFNNDIYWINQLSLNKNINKQFRQHIQEFIDQSKQQLDKPMNAFLNQEILKNFHKVQKQKKDEGIHSIINRNKQYGKRKVKYYEKLLKGQVKELDLLPEDQQEDSENDQQNEDIDQYDSDSDEQSSSSDDDNDENINDEDDNNNFQEKDSKNMEIKISPNQKLVEEKIEKLNITKKRTLNEFLQGNSEKLKHEEDQKVKKHIKLQYEKQTNQNNIQIWRDNFNAVKNNMEVEDTAFSECQYCKQIKYLCRCNLNESTKQDIQIVQQFFEKPQNQAKRFVLKYKPKCPSFNQIMATGISKQVEHQYAYYENLEDLFEHYNLKNKSVQRNLYFAQILEKDIIKTPQHKQYYVGIQNNLKLPKYFRAYITEDYDSQQQFQETKQRFRYQKKCPSFKQISADIIKSNKKQNKQLLNVTPVTKNWLSPFSHSQKQEKLTENQQNQNKKLTQYHEDITMYTFEIFAKSTPDMLPDPSSDPINFIVFDLENFKRSEINTQGIILVDEINCHEPIDKVRKYYGFNDSMFKTIIVTKNEEELLLTFIKQIHIFNVDIITGWDIEKKSLFYFSHRCWQLGIDVMDILSRCPKNSFNILRAFKLADCLIEEQFQNDSAKGYSQQSMSFDSNQSFKLQNVAMQSIKQSHRSAKQTGFFANFKLNFEIAGRMIINTWRLVKHDYKLFCYELESVVNYVFQERIPIFSNWSLTQMYNHEDIKQRVFVFEYMMKRLMKTKDIIDHIQIINTCAEETKLYGFDFQSAICKGHQFRIEHIMNRVTDLLGYKLMSASRYGVQTQRMLECSPLTLEPPKLFYVDPVIVLDFISLYPSIMIAYNLCFSTCLGYIDDNFQKGGFKKLGVQKQWDVQFEELLKKHNYDIDELMKDIFVAPNKVAFVKKSVREGVLSQITHEFFFTRQFIKGNMGKYKQNPLYNHIYNKLQQRQKSLKLFMCVIFGYTGATFSGRMPLGDLADSIIQIGKFLLNQAINLINNSKKWGAQVIYGDTDSVFVNIKGVSVNDAIKIGKEIESEVSKMFPYPLKLKYEKTYQNLVILTKKRYAGFFVENETDEPKFEAKGLEVMRKDGCQALSIIMKNCLETLLKNKNLSAIKLYLNGEWQKLLNDQFSYRDLIISKECKLENYTMPPPHARIALKEMKRDPQTKPKYGQRIKYFIINNPQSQRLYDCVVSVNEFMKNYRHQINLNEYLEKQINSALGRLFSTFDVDIQDWVQRIKKSEIKSHNILAIQNKQQKGGLSSEFQKQKKQFQLNHYYLKEICIACSNKTKNQICENCLQDPSALIFILTQKKKINEMKLQKLIDKCTNCCNLSQIEEMPQCIQYECYTYFEKKNAEEVVEVINPYLEQYTSMLYNLANEF